MKIVKCKSLNSVSVPVERVRKTVTDTDHGHGIFQFALCISLSARESEDIGGQKCPPYSIILALNQALSKELPRVLREEKDFSVLEGTQSFSQIEDILSRQKIDVVIVEVEGLQDLLGIKRLIQKGKDLKVVIMGDIDKDVALEYIKLGAKGYLSYNTPPDLLKKAIRVIHEGEVWIDRKTASIAFEEFARLALERGQPEIMECLSKREKEVLHLVAKGCKNRDIALALYISEKTVKTHLYHIFEKLGVKDRLKAALLVTKKE